MLLLCLIVLSIFGVKQLLSSYDGGKVVPLTNEERLDIIAFQNNLVYNLPSWYRKYQYRKFRDKNGRVIEQFPFDPNTADSTALYRLGLYSWQIKNLYKYRAMGGRFRKPDDFSKLYGLSSVDFQRLKPFIFIQGKDEYVPEKTLFVDDSLMHYPEKFKKGTVIDINAADTSILKRVPGIGSGLAAAIVNYRNRLGGYVSVRQVFESSEFLPRDIDEWFDVGNVFPVKMNINKLGIEQLRRHPYINFYQARTICEHRKKYGNISTLKQLSLYDCFKSQDLERLAPYVCY